MISKKITTKIFFYPDLPDPRILDPHGHQIRIRIYKIRIRIYQIRIRI